MKQIDDLQEQLVNFITTQVCIVDNNTFVLVANWYPKDKPETYEGAEKYPSKVISININTKTVGWTLYDTGLLKSYTDGGYIDGKKIALSSDLNANFCVFNYENGDNGSEPSETHFAVRNIRLIGQHFYAASSRRNIYRRNSKNSWEMISATPHQLDNPNNIATHAIDGFSENDMYMCGDFGDLWHYNGSIWKQLDPPCNWHMAFLICANNGMVYVGGEQGQLLAGKNGNWEEVITQELAFNKGYTAYDMTFFKDTLYIATGFSVYSLKENSWVSVDGISSRSTLECIDSNSDIMIIGGKDKITIFDGKKEEILYSDNSDLNKAKIVASSIASIADDIRDTGDELLDTIQLMKPKK